MSRRLSQKKEHTLLVFFPLVGKYYLRCYLAVLETTCYIPREFVSVGFDRNFVPSRPSERARGKVHCCYIFGKSWEPSAESGEDESRR